MIIINKIRQYFHSLSLGRKLKKLKIERQFINLDDAKTIGILYNATQPDHNIIVTKFYELLRQKRKKVTLLGYVEDNKPILDASAPLFNNKNLNWKLQPVSERVDDFINKEFDILINAFIGDNLPLEYIATLSRAKYRVGEYRSNKTYCYELMIHLGERNELQYLLDQVAHYLNLINKNENQTSRNRNRTDYAVS